MPQDLNQELWRTWLGTARSLAYESMRSRQTLENLATWNQRLSASLFCDVSHVEIAIRNLISESLQKRALDLGQGTHWLMDSSGYFQRTGGRDFEALLGQAQQRVLRAKQEPTWDDIVAELGLGFWLSFLGRKYLAIHPDLASAFVGLEDRNIRRLRPLAERFRNLRNRLAHHHRVIHRDLNRDWHDVVGIAQLIDPKLKSYLSENSNTPELIAEFNQTIQAECSSSSHEPG